MKCIVRTRTHTIPSSLGGPTSSGNFSPLTTSFNISIHGESWDTSQYGGLRHTRGHRHVTPSMGGQSVWDCLVISLVAGSLLPTSSDVSSLSELAAITTPVEVPVPLMSDVTHKPDSPIKDKPSDLGLKPIMTKNRGLTQRKLLSLVFVAPLTGLVPLALSLQQTQPWLQAFGGRKLLLTSVNYLFQICLLGRLVLTARDLNALTTLTATSTPPAP
jgi:hypothetical protein